MSKQAAEHHRKAAQHHEHAARHHNEAAKHYEAGITKWGPIMPTLHTDIFFTLHIMRQKQQSPMLKTTVKKQRQLPIKLWGITESSDD